MKKSEMLELLAKIGLSQINKMNSDKILSSLESEAVKFLENACCFYTFQCISKNVTPKIMVTA
jgi:hypothetical protein